MERGLGPFGRSFLGEFPTRGTLGMCFLSILLSFILAGGLFSWIFLSVITTFSMVYLCYNVIEPHFNTGESQRDFLNDFDVLPSGLSDKMKRAYRDSGITEIWDFTGKQISQSFGNSASSLETKITADGHGRENIGFSEKKWVSWMFILSFTFLWWLALFISSIGVFFALYFAGVSEGMAISLSGIVAYLILVPLTILFIYIDGNLKRTAELLRFGSPKRVVILILGIPLIVTIIDYILVMIYATFWIGIFGEPSINTDVGTNWDSSTLEIAILFLSIAVVTPIAEELMFRGYILDAINRKHSDWTSIIWSSLLFGLVHLNPFVMGQAFMGGMVYGWIRVRTGSILPTIACHMMWNTLALSLTYL